MADAVASTPTVSAAKKASKSSKAKKPANHPKYSEMLQKAINALKERGGSSRQAILKYIIANFNVGKDEKTINSHLKLALRAGVKSGGLKQSKGTGASGSFKLGAPAATTAAAKPKKAKPAKKVKKPKSPAKPKVKKAAGTKKAASPKKAKPAKAKKAATPKKTKPVKAKKSPKVKAAKPMKPKTPKKAAKSPKKTKG